MTTPIPAEDEALVERYLAEFHASLPPTTPIDRDRARRAELTANARAILGLVRALIAASPSSTA